MNNVQDTGESGDGVQALTGAITHFGLFWSERDVRWSGVRAKPAVLKGRPKTRLERRGRPTRTEEGEAQDFSEFVGVYCLYREGRLVYVGEAGLQKKRSIFQRLIAHRRNQLADRWDEFSWFGCSKAHLEEQNLSTTACLAQLEAILIAAVNPGSNRQNGSFANAVQVFQVPDEDAEGDTDTNLARILERLEALGSRIPDPSKRKPGRPKKSCP
jgi:hypothetical protein